MGVDEGNLQVIDVDVILESCPSAVLACHLQQVAEQAHPLVQRCPSPNPMREHRNHRTHEEVVVGGGATPHG